MWSFARTFRTQSPLIPRRLGLLASETLARMAKVTPSSVTMGQVDWKPEFAQFQLEGTPGQPYGATTNELLKIEHNMRLCRAIANYFLGEGAFVVTIPTFPLLGQPQCFFPDCTVTKETTPFSGSLFVPDCVINPHPRFPTLVNNIRTRRGEKVCMHLPVFRDARTGDAKLTKDVTDAQREVGGKVIDLLDLNGTKVEEEVYMDSMAFGMGMCCLQITFQALDINEARDLYDQLAVVAPLFMAISAGTPMIKGWLLDTDTRWDVISGSVDCRSHSPPLQPSQLLTETLTEHASSVDLSPIRRRSKPGAARTGSRSRATAQSACSSAARMTWSSSTTCTRPWTSSPSTGCKARESTQCSPATLRTCSAAALWLFSMTALKWMTSKKLSTSRTCRVRFVLPAI